MFSAASITIPTEGFTPVQGHSDAWIDRMGDLLSRHFFDLPPDLPGSLADLPTIRSYYREMLGDLGAMVEVERERVGPHLALRTIVKLPQQPRGMTYVASLTFPFRTCSFVVKVACPEQAMIGLRDTFMSAELGIRTEGRDWICADGRPWFADPYDPEYVSVVRRNRSDDEEWDAAFVGHPLTRAREQVRRTLRQATLPPEALALPAFG